MMVRVIFGYRGAGERHHRVSVMEDGATRVQRLSWEIDFSLVGWTGDRGWILVDNSVPASVMRQIALFMFLGATLPGTNRYEAEGAKEAIIAVENARALTSPPMFINGVLVIDLGTVARGL